MIIDAGACSYTSEAVDSFCLYIIKRSRFYPTENRNLTVPHEIDALSKHSELSRNVLIGISMSHSTKFEFILKGH